MSMISILEKILAISVELTTFG